MKKALRTEGLRLSPSSAANLLGAIRVAESLESGTVLTVFPDNADKYSDLLEQLGI
jgi:cysteine synthase B